MITRASAWSIHSMAQGGPGPCTCMFLFLTASGSDWQPTAADDCH